MAFVWSRYARVATGAVTALLALATILLLTVGKQRQEVPSPLLEVMAPIFTLLIGLWLKQGQKETQRKIDAEMPTRIENGVRDLLDTAEARGFTRGEHATARTILESLPIPYVEVSASTMRIVRVNEHFLELAGYARGELIGENVQVLVPEAHRAQHLSEMRRYVDDPHARPMGVSRAVVLRRKDGSEVSVQVMLGTFMGLAELVIISLVWPLRQRSWSA